MVKRPLLLFSLVTIITVILDQVTKYFILIRQAKLLWGAFGIVFATNTGAGFGILQDQPISLGIISMAVAVGILLFYKHIPKDNWHQLFFALFLGGVIGNGIDRLVRKYVIDFFYTTFWPTFNVADAAISVGAVGLLVLSYIYREQPVKEEPVKKNKKQKTPYVRKKTKVAKR